MSACRRREAIRKGGVAGCGSDTVEVPHCSVTDRRGVAGLHGWRPHGGERKPFRARRPGTASWECTSVTGFNPIQPLLTPKYC
jgi:hypothetical protein